MLIKEYTARVVEAIGCGAIIGAILGLLMGVFITGNADAPSLEYFIFGGVILGGMITFISGFIRDIHIVKKTFAEKMKGLKEKEKISLLAEVLEKELIPIQIWAITELGKIRSEKAMAELEKALNHNSRHIQRKATEVLRKLDLKREYSTL